MNAFYGQGNGPVWFDNLQCSGQEGNIGACTNPGLGTLADNCGDHSQDAGVVCASKYNLYKHNGLLVSQIIFKFYIDNINATYLNIDNTY